jgi:RecA/RadA recombinase
VFGLPLFPYSSNDEFNSRQRIKDIQTAIAETTALHAQDYFEHLYSSLTNNSNDYQLRLSVISDALKLLERYSLQARTLEAELVEENEAGKLLLQAQQLTQTLRDMTGAAEELWCFIVGDPDATKLIQQYSRGELRFQRPNIDK